MHGSTLQACGIGIQRPFNKTDRLKYEIQSKRMHLFIEMDDIQENM